MKKIILSVIALGALLSSCAKYDEAIVLLKEAHYDALLDKDVKRFENAILYSFSDEA